MNSFTKGLILLVACASADTTNPVVEDCSNVMNSEPGFLDICQRACGLTLAQQRCGNPASGTDLADCVAKLYPYCSTLAVDPKLIGGCKTLIAAEPDNYDVCKRMCSASIVSKHCQFKTTAYDLADCVSDNYSYCYVNQLFPKYVSDCKTVITAQPAEEEFVEMCQRNCATVVKDKRCAGMTSGTELADCVSKNYAYCLRK